MKEAKKAVADTLAAEDREREQRHREKGKAKRAG
jgi:hypothetical protein